MKRSTIFLKYVTSACIIILLSVYLFPTYGAKVSNGAQLTINFNYKDNNNQLRGKGLGYAIQEDGYKETIWIEGPYDPAVPCQITNFQRQNIKLVKVITFYANGLTRDTTAIRPNSWHFVDYNTPDFLAALMVSGMYYYCPSWPFAETEDCADTKLAPTTSRRQNPTKGGLDCGATVGTITPVCATVQYPKSIGFVQNGNVTRVPDGVSGATVYPGSTVVHTWDMKDMNGSLIEEGYYLVYVQMSAERFPRSMEYGEMSGGKLAVGMETCWDDPAYDNVGNHRVTELFHFKNSSISKVITKEKKWSGDSFDYLNGSMTFNYSVPVAAIPGNVHFLTSKYSVQEGSNTITIAVKRSAGNLGSVSVNYATSNNTAQAGSDYTIASGTISFATGDTSTKTFSVPILEDTTEEGTESFAITLSTVTGGASLGIPKITTVTIFDNDFSVPSGGLAGYWKLNEGSGSTTNDASANANHGTIMGTSWGNGTLGSGLNFDGVDDYVDVGKTASLNITGPLTIAAWVYPNVNNVSMVFVEGLDQYVFWIQQNNELRLADDRGNYVDTPPNVLTLNAWNHLVAVFSGVSGNAVTLNNAKIYLNGTSRGNHTSGTWNPVAQLLNATRIGGGNGYNFFNGGIDEVLIYNRALTSQEIQKLYSATSPIADFTQNKKVLSDFFVYPNPVGHQKSIQLYLPQIHDRNISSTAYLFLYNLTGELVRTISFTSDGSPVKMSLTDKGKSIASGIYHAHVLMGQELYTKKIIVWK